MTKYQLRWFGHIQRWPQEVSARRVDCIFLAWEKGEKRDQKRHRRKLSREISDLIIFLKL